MYQIYKHTVPNGKIYIGRTKLSLNKRFQGGSGYRTNKVFYADILAYGWNNIKHEVLETVETIEEASEREGYYILKYRANEPEYGYNKFSNQQKYGSNYKPKGYKKVECIETGIIYDSASVASRETGIDNSAITKCCKGMRKTIGGYHWKYVEMIE